jgi:cytidylate kinase
MHHSRASERVTGALTQALHHWESRHQAEAADPRAGRTAPAVTIALSREAGANAEAVARAAAGRLGWPVYDQELLRRIADEMGVHASLLASVDERRRPWLSECLEGFATNPAVSQGAYVRRLVETVLSLATHGECVIVGRGATHILPAATTLRVRLVAPLEARVESLRRREKLGHAEAARRVAELDRERAHFVREHFQKDTSDTHLYDLVLNTGRFSVAECAELIVEAARRLGRHAAAASPEPAACMAVAGA